MSKVTPLFTLVEDGTIYHIGDVRNLRDPSRVTSTEFVEECRKDERQGWRFWLGADGAVNVEMELLGIESSRRPDHLRRRSATIELVRKPRSNDHE